MNLPIKVITQNKGWMRNRKTKTSIKHHKIVILKAPLPFLFGCSITLSVELQQMLKTRQTQPTKTFIQQHELILRLCCLVWCLLLLYRFISFCFVSCFFLCVLIIVCAMWATRTPRNNGAQWCWWFVVCVWIRMNCYANCMDVVSKRFWTFLTLSELFWTFCLNFVSSEKFENKNRKVQKSEDCHGKYLKQLSNNTHEL